MVGQIAMIFSAALIAFLFIILPIFSFFPEPFGLLLVWLGIDKNNRFEQLLGAAFMLMGTAFFFWSLAALENSDMLQFIILLVPSFVFIALGVLAWNGYVNRFLGKKEKQPEN